MAPLSSIASEHQAMLLLSLGIGVLAGCSRNPIPSSIPGYDLERPLTTIVLPEILHEISGITEVGPMIIACVQDEKGIVFFYDLTKQGIVRQAEFHLDGDYEGIARVGKALYVLRSDGTLFEIADYEAQGARAQPFSLGGPGRNNEGLCYDPSRGILLVAAKGKLGKGAEHKDLRVVHAFDPRTKTLSQAPILSIDLQKVRAFLRERDPGFPTRERKGSREPKVRLNTSDIGVHPVTHQFFLLSVPDHALFVFDPSGEVAHIQRLNPALFNKPEGIAFLPDGDMLISNEGEDMKPTLLRFDYAPGPEKR